MKHTLLLATATLVSLLGASFQAHAEDPIKVGISGEPYPPFTYKASSGEWTGFEVDLALAICDEMGRRCEITPTGWSGIIPSLNDGRIDLIMNSMSITAQRQEVIDFSIPYYFTPGAYVAAEDRDLSIPDGLDGLVLGVQAATTNASYARRALRDSGVDIRLYNQAEQVNADLLSGRLDVILADQIAMVQFIEREEASGFDIKETAPRHEAYGEGIGIGLRQDDDALESDLNVAVRTVIDNGTCARLSEEYLGTDVCVYE